MKLISNLFRFTQPKKKKNPKKTQRRLTYKDSDNEGEDSDTAYGFNNTGNWDTEFGMSYTDLKNVVETQKKKKKGGKVDDSVINDVRLATFFYSNLIAILMWCCRNQTYVAMYDFLFVVYKEIREWSFSYLYGNSDDRIHAGNCCKVGSYQTAIHNTARRSHWRYDCLCKVS